MALHLSRRQAQTIANNRSSIAGDLKEPISIGASAPVRDNPPSPESQRSPGLDRPPPNTEPAAPTRPIGRRRQPRHTARPARSPARGQRVLDRRLAHRPGRALRKIKSDRRASTQGLPNRPRTNAAVGADRAGLRRARPRARAVEALREALPDPRARPFAHRSGLRRTATIRRGLGDPEGETHRHPSGRHRRIHRRCGHARLAARPPADDQNTGTAAKTSRHPEAPRDPHRLRKNRPRASNRPHRPPPISPTCRDSKPAST